MVKESAKAITYNIITILLIGMVFLLIMFFYISASAESAKYEQSLITCNQFFKSINGKSLYFNETVNTFTPKLSNSLRDLCPSKTVQVSSQNVKPALDLMKDCWFKTGSGTDIFPMIATDMKLCFYCGKITSNTNIESFKEKIDAELRHEKYADLLSKESEIINLNYATFENSIPETLDKEHELALYYYVYKPPVELGDNLIENMQTFAKDVINRGIRDFVGEHMDIGPALNYYGLDEFLIGELVKTSGGLVIISEDNTDKQDFDKVENYIVTRGCYTIYPLKNYD
jgi:hypothetical protein